METSAFIEAITETLLISTAQAFAIVLFFRVMFSAVPDIPSAIRYRLWYSSLVLIFGLFVYTLLSMYSQKVLGDALPGAVSAVQVEYQHTSWLAKLETIKSKYAGLIASLYFVGVGIQFLSLTLAWFKARSLGNGETLLKDPMWTSRLNALRERLQIPKQVTLHISENITVPITAGFIKPIILLPVAMVSRLDPEQVEAILLHELAHIKRLDYLWNIVQKVMESILFFNPFVWLIVKEIHKEREYCCDEIVVSKTSDPITYAKALLQLEVQVKYNELAMAATGTEKYPLFDRIKRISGMKNPDPSPKTGIIVLATILCIGLSLAVALPQNEKSIMRAQEKSTIVNNKRFVTRVNTTQTVSTIPDEGRPVTTKFVMKAPSKNDTVCLENKNLSVVQEELTEHTEVLIKHTLEHARHQESIKKHAEELRKHFESRQWKEMQTELVERSVAVAKAAMLAQKFMEQTPAPPAIPEIPENQGKFQRKIEQLQKKVESPEWQNKQIQLHRKIANITKKITSADWDKAGEEIGLQVETLVRGLDAGSLTVH